MSKQIFQLKSFKIFALNKIVMLQVAIFIRIVNIIVLLADMTTLH